MCKNLCWFRNVESCRNFIFHFIFCKSDFLHLISLQQLLTIFRSFFSKVYWCKGERHVTLKTLHEWSKISKKLIEGKNRLNFTFSRENKSKVWRWRPAGILNVSEFWKAVKEGLLNNVMRQMMAKIIWVIVWLTI